MKIGYEFIDNLEYKSRSNIDGCFKCDRIIIYRNIFDPILIFLGFYEIIPIIANIRIK